MNEVDSVVAAMRVISDTALESDKAMLKLIEAVINRVTELERRAEIQEKFLRVILECMGQTEIQ